ncbi:uncharacterized protein DUF222 [Actinomycetospora succinea]|uniref:Uncharacterized protein DUF222 n=1 Tax=Actinomycetospora succinea TaxID=663603 RepID=A0A4R6VHI5_9PSEU|nr:DUF222 domain-containing protein [Actinomycetospora succinea]TDQ62514.1 uncharacterized protein DUF222 [Actinomycetospora succinea]
MFDSGWTAVVEEPRPSASPCWSQWTPGPELAVALEACEPVDVAVDEGYDAAERLAGYEALANWAAGRLYRETAEYLQARQAVVRGAGRAELISESVAMEVAALGRVAARTGEIRVFQAEMLLDRLPHTLSALEEGRISLGHARVVLEQVEGCDRETARLVDAELWLRTPRDRTPTQLRDVVRRIITRLAPDMIRRRPEQAMTKRGLRYWSDDHGATGVLQLRLPADQARGVYSVIDAVARRAGDDPGAPRDMVQKRGDTTRDLVLDGAAAHGVPCDPDCCPDDDHDDPVGSAGEANDGAADDGAAGDGATGDGAASDNAANDGRTGDDATSDDATGDGASADGATGDDATGDGASADGATGDDATADDLTGDDPTGDGRTGDGAAGSDQPTGDGSPPDDSDSTDARDPVRGVRRGTRSPVRTEVRVTIGWDVLAGLSDRPGELEGHGPILAAMARRLASNPDAWWRRLFTDPVTGTASHLDARRYRPPAAMQDFVRARDMTCAAPGCRVPASRCDLDHVARYEHHRPGGGTGPTRADKLKPACRRHHRIKTHGQWSAALEPDPDGGAAPVITWTSPSGHRWSVRSPELDPPWWERDTEPDTPDPGWPRDIDSWRRREAQPPPGDPWRRRAV